MTRAKLVLIAAACTFLAGCHRDLAPYVGAYKAKVTVSQHKRVGRLTEPTKGETSNAPVLKLRRNSSFELDFGDLYAGSWAVKDQTITLTYNLINGRKITDRAYVLSYSNITTKSPPSWQKELSQDTLDIKKEGSKIVLTVTNSRGVAYSFVQIGQSVLR